MSESVNEREPVVSAVHSFMLSLFHWQASSSAQHIPHCSPWAQAHDQLPFPTYFRVYALANVAIGSELEISRGFLVRGHLLDICSCHEVQEVVKD